MGVASGCGYQEVGVASGSGWILLVGGMYGCGYHIEMDSNEHAYK